MITLNNLETSVFGRNFIHLETIDSTNEYLKREAKNIAEGTAVIADFQTNGKGRRGKTWVSADSPEWALYLSIILRPPGIQHIAKLPLVMGIALKKSLAEIYGNIFSMKWPNDLVAGSKKVAGILCDGVFSNQSAAIICGIGVNILQPLDFFRQNELPYATSLLLQSLKSSTREKIAEGFLNTFEPMYYKLLDKGFVPFKSEYSMGCISVGKMVIVESESGDKNGLCVGISDEGELMVNIAGKVERFNSGEVSVRGIYGK